MFSGKKLLMSLPVQVHKSVLDHIYIFLLVVSIFVLLFLQCNWDAGT